MMVSDPVYDAFRPTAMADTNIADIKQVIVAACKEVTQQHWVTVLPTPNSFSFYQPWLNGYIGQGGAFGGSAGLLGWYGSRFWINQTLKTSMGH